MYLDYATLRIRAQSQWQSSAKSFLLAVELVGAYFSIAETDRQVEIVFVDKGAMYGEGQTSSL